MLSHNSIAEVSGEEFMASLKYLDVSHNCLTQLSDFAESLGRRCFQLEVLNLSYNALDEEGTVFLQQVAVPKWALQMKQLRQVDWMPQKDTTTAAASVEV